MDPNNEAIILKAADYEVTFLPQKGMNLCSFKRGSLEVIDQSTQKEFENRFSGLGALIGPHFHRRNKNIPAIDFDTSLFPHVAYCKEHGIEDPFSHGISRYAPWKCQVKENTIEATLSGKTEWQGVQLAKIEGQNFEMKFIASLNEHGLILNLSVVSEKDSIVGIHYYYRLPKGQSVVKADVQDRIYDQKELKSIPKEWGYQNHQLNFNLSHPADFTFFPYPDPLKGSIELITAEYRLRTSYRCISQENSFQLYHPKDSSFVCIEPLSAQDPHHPNLTVSQIEIHLQIE